MNEEPIEAKEVRHITIEQLLEWSQEEMKRRLGLPYKEMSPFSPKVVEADKPSEQESERSCLKRDLPEEENNE